ncbi:MAG TPA: lysylphosphatidylglycerol synthase domain-containing protein [Steroidobacteraceae bacterium]|nr:lysylphosphatidylglycerol synthase domain-containing protein [Steroidobacteraceae bacterium]
MKRARALLGLGLILLVVLLVRQGWAAWLELARLAGLGLVLVVLFHGVPLLIDTAALRVLSKRGHGSMRDALVARWAGESANSLLPAGQIGGPLLMARELARRGTPPGEALAWVTVALTLQTLALLAFMLFGLAAVAARVGVEPGAARSAILVSGGVLAFLILVFYGAQRRGLFSRALRLVGRWLNPDDHARWMGHAEAVEQELADTYKRGGAVAASFALSLLGWIAGTGEVYLTLRLLGHPVGWDAALLIESLGQTIRSAAFAVPAALGVQDGGYLLLTSLVGLPASTGLALALTKRARELILGAPGLWYLHLAERRAGTASRADSIAP